MTFSQEWDNRFRENTHISLWPWSDLVSYVMRYARPNKTNFRVLELGCGSGANIPFFMSLDVEYYAVEGSNTMVKRLKEKFPKLAPNIVEKDFTQGIPFQVDFDLIVDRAALAHNTTKGIRQCLIHVNKKLKANGKYIGIDWFSTSHSEYLKGKKSEDVFTRTGYNSGVFANLGKVHFSDKIHLVDLFNEFEIIQLDHKLSKTEIPNNGLVIASWNFVAQKK